MSLAAPEVAFAEAQTFFSRCSISSVRIKLISRRMAFSGDPLETVSVENGIARFNAIGMAVTLIETAALRRMVEQAPLKPLVTFFRTKDFPVYGFFNRATDPAGNLMAEDFSFCARWRACGGEVWVLVDDPILHVGTYAYGGSYLDTLTDQGRT
jgi:hypothetical protein